MGKKGKRKHDFCLAFGQHVHQLNSEKTSCWSRDAIEHSYRLRLQHLQGHETFLSAKRPHLLRRPTILIFKGSSEEHRDRGVMVNTPLHHVPRLRMSGAIPLLPQHSYSFASLPHKRSFQRRNLFFHSCCKQSVLQKFSAWPALHTAHIRTVAVLCVNN